MKKILLILMACLLVVGAADAQGKKKKGKKGDSPVIEGCQKVRESDYATYDRFTQFTTKDMDRYFTPFDYSGMCSITQEKEPEWGSLKPVMNYLEKVSRATLTMCAIYAVNPNIEDTKEHKRIADEGREEALKAVECFEAWKVRNEWRNKIQYRVAEVDYRYFKGASYFDDQSGDELIHVGVILYFGTKKKPVFDPDTTTRTFADIKFFPNDATIVESWYSHLDEISVRVVPEDRSAVERFGFVGIVHALDVAHRQIAAGRVDVRVRRAQMMQVAAAVALLKTASGLRPDVLAVEVSAQLVRIEQDRVCRAVVRVGFRPVVYQRTVADVG